jgi:hypothetical protein
MLSSSQEKKSLTRGGLALFWKNNYEEQEMLKKNFFF